MILSLTHTIDWKTVEKFNEGKTIDRDAVIKQVTPKVRVLAANRISEMLLIDANKEPWQDKTTVGSTFIFMPVGDWATIKKKLQVIARKSPAMRPIAWDIIDNIEAGIKAPKKEAANG